MLEQYYPGRCLECDTEMELENITRIGEYPIGGFRNSMKPNQTKAAIYECPKCFVFSCCHATESVIDLINRRSKT